VALPAPLSGCGLAGFFSPGTAAVKYAGSFFFALGFAAPGF